MKTKKWNEKKGEKIKLRKAELLVWLKLMDCIKIATMNLIINQ